MSTLLIKRINGDDLPRKTRVRIVTHPNGLRIWKGVVSRSATVDLDPGAYSIVRHKSTKMSTGKFSCFKEVNVVYHDITKEQLRKIEEKESRHIKSVVTTHGNRWRCTYPGCDVTDLTSSIAGKVHELEQHYGQFPLGRPDDLVPDEPVSEEVEQVAESKQPAPRARARRPPPKPSTPARSRGNGE